MSALKPRAIQFLRELGMPEDGCRALLAGAYTTVTPEVLADYVRVAYRAGQQRTDDPYRWYSVAELIGQARAAERFSK